MDLEIIILSEVNQTKTNITHVWTLIFKNDTNELIYKLKQTHRFCKQTYGYQKGNLG